MAQENMANFFVGGKVEKCAGVLVAVVVRVKKINPVKGAFLGLRLAVSERSRKGKKYNKKKEVSKAPETMNSNEGETEGRVKKKFKIAPIASHGAITSRSQGRCLAAAPAGGAKKRKRI